MVSGYKENETYYFMKLINVDDIVQLFGLKLKNIVKGDEII
jgi:hypothetical protein